MKVRTYGQSSKEISSSMFHEAAMCRVIHSLKWKSEKTRPRICLGQLNSLVPRFEHRLQNYFHCHIPQKFWPSSTIDFSDPTNKFHLFVRVGVDSVITFINETAMRYIENVLWDGKSFDENYNGNFWE